MKMTYSFIILKMLSIFLSSLLLTGLIVFISKKIGFVNHPNPIVETHKAPVPYGGGIAIGLTIIIMMIFNSGSPEEVFKLVILIIPVLIAGTIDDSVRLSPPLKLVSEIISVLPFILIYLNLSVLHIFIFLLVILAV